jgi:hypothetical protein
MASYGIPVTPPSVALLLLRRYGRYPATKSPVAYVSLGWAGNGPYFSHRASIDLLGKSDRHIAHMRAVSTTFFRPGHIKFDLDYSIGKLRPDLVEGLDGDWSRKYGYTQVAPGMWVRNDSTRVDRALLARLGHDLRPAQV